MIHYFTRFGKDAEMLLPLKLRSAAEKFYKEGLAVYEEKEKASIKESKL